MRLRGGTIKSMDYKIGDKVVYPNHGIGTIEEIEQKINRIVFRNLPRKAAMELMLTGKRIDAAEAVRLGLINRRVPAAQLDPEVDALTDELSRKSPIGMKLGLEAFYKMQDMSFPAAMAYLQDQLALLSLSDDLKEGVTAFVEKRPPKFTGD